MRNWASVAVIVPALPDEAGGEVAWKHADAAMLADVSSRGAPWHDKSA